MIPGSLAIPTRRSFITGLITLVAAPAIVRAGSLMPVKQVIFPTIQPGASFFSPPEGRFIHPSELNELLYGDNQTIRFGGESFKLYIEAAIRGD